MAKKQTATPTSEPVPADVISNYTDGDPADKTNPIRVWQEGDTTVDYLHDRPRDREVFIGGVPHDHVATAPDGVWVYRQDRKN